MKTFAYTTRYKTLPGDLHTPVSTYLKVRDLFPQSILLESSDYHGVENNRSFIGLNPIASFSVNHGIVTTVFPAVKSVRSLPSSRWKMLSSIS